MPMTIVLTSKEADAIPNPQKNKLRPLLHLCYSLTTVSNLLTRGVLRVKIQTYGASVQRQKKL